MPDVTMFIDEFIVEQLPEFPAAGTIEDELQVIVARTMSCKANDGTEVGLRAGDVDVTVVEVSMSRGPSIKVIVTAHDHHDDRMANISERLNAIKSEIRYWWRDNPEGLPYVSVRFQPIRPDYWVYDE